MCGWHVMAPHGYWVDTLNTRGTYLVVRRKKGGKALYFRMHDDIAIEREHKRRIIRLMKKSNWRVEACVTIKRCYPRPAWETQPVQPLQKAQTDQGYYRGAQARCTCGYNRGYGTRHLGGCPRYSPD